MRLLVYEWSSEEVTMPELGTDQKAEVYMCPASSGVMEVFLVSLV
jgi:hypothetical protein